MAKIGQGGIVLVGQIIGRGHAAHLYRITI
jgi:hypothetical protein